VPPNPYTAGLISCGPNTLDAIRRVTGYVDRMPANLPVQTRTKCENGASHPSLRRNKSIAVGCIPDIGQNWRELHQP
jgi:hypothetical protein